MRRCRLFIVSKSFELRNLSQQANGREHDHERGVRKYASKPIVIVYPGKTTAAISGQLQLSHADAINQPAKMKVRGCVFTCIK